MEGTANEHAEGVSSRQSRYSIVPKSFALQRCSKPLSAHLKFFEHCIPPMISSIFFLSSSLMASSFDAELRLYGFPIRTLREASPLFRAAYQSRGDRVNGPTYLAASVGKCGRRGHSALPPGILFEVGGDEANSQKHHERRGRPRRSWDAVCGYYFGGLYLQAM